MSGLKRREHQRLSGRGIEGGVRMDPARDATSVEIDNLSRGGLFACTRFPLEPGAVVWFELEHPVDRVRITLRGRVVSALTPREALKKGVAAGFGLEFLDVGAAEAARLEDLLAWSKNPRAYVQRPVASAQPRAPASAQTSVKKPESKSAFDFAFSSLTEEDDFSWGGSHRAELTPCRNAVQPQKAQPAPAQQARPHARPQPSAPPGLERRIAYVRFLEQERVRLLAELEEKKRQLAKLRPG